MRKLGLFLSDQAVQQLPSRLVVFIGQQALIALNI